MNILIGKNVEEKTKWLFGQIRNRINMNSLEEHVIIVPEQYTVQAEMNYINTTNVCGFINPEILSFNRLAHRIIQETGGRTRVLIDDLGKHMLVKRILVDLEKDLVLLGPSSQETGLVEKIVESIAELKQYEVTPDNLEQIIEIFREDRILYGKLADMSKIYKKFAQDLALHYVDQEDLYASMIQQMPYSNFIKNKVVWIDGYFSFTPQMLSIIRTLNKESKEVNLTFHGVPEWLQQHEHPLAGQMVRLLKDLEKSGDPCIIMDVGKTIKNTRKDPAIQFLSEHFNQLPIESWELDTNAVHIYSASNDDTEIEMVTAQILKLVHTKDFRFNQIFVLCANLEERQDSIKRIFTSQRIPFFLDARRKKIDLPLIRLIPSVLEVVLKNYSYQSMFRFLKTGYSGLTHSDVEALENFVIAKGIRGFAWKKAFSQKGDQDDLERVNSLRKSVMEPFSALEKDLQSSENVREMTLAVFRWMEICGIDGLVTTEKKLFLDHDEPEIASLISQLWEKHNDLMDQLVELMGSTSLSVKEYQGLWKTGLDSIDIGVIPTKIDQVMIGTPERSRLSGSKALFLIGINDGVLPALRTDSGMLMSYEKELINKSGYLLGVQGEERAAQEALMVSMALGKPEEFLWLSYSQATLDGEIRRPSTMIDRIKRILPKAVSTSDISQQPQDEIDMLWDPHHSFLPLAISLRRLGDGKTVPKHWTSLYKWYVNQKRWSVDMEYLKMALYYTNQPENLKSPLTEALFGTRYTGSVTRLEQYNRCPFAHYVRYGLKPFKKKKQEVLAPDIGMVLHEIMEQIGRKIVSGDMDFRQIEDQTIESISGEVATKVIERYGDSLFESSPRFRHQGERIKRIGVESVKTMMYQLQKSGFITVQNEMSFGSPTTGGKQTPFTIISAEGGVIELEGRIDRVDEWKDETCRYYRIVDYKLGTRKFSYVELMQGLQMQLMVYLMAAKDWAKKNHPDDSVKPAGAYYFYFEDPWVEITSDDEELAKAKRRELRRFNGLTLHDMRVIHEMDREMVEDSDVIPIKLTVAGDVKKSAATVTEKEFAMLQEYTKDIISKTAQDILRGVIRIMPVGIKGWKSCDYCEYLSICQFDQQFPENYLKKPKAEDEGKALTIMTKPGKEGGDHGASMD